MGLTGTLPHRIFIATVAKEPKVRGGELRRVQRCGSGRVQFVVRVGRGGCKEHTAAGRRAARGSGRLPSVAAAVAAGTAAALPGMGLSNDGCMIRRKGTEPAGLSGIQGNAKHAWKYVLTGQIQH